MKGVKGRQGLETTITYAATLPPFPCAPSSKLVVRLVASALGSGTAYIVGSMRDPQMAWSKRHARSTAQPVDPGRHVLILRVVHAKIRAGPPAITV